MNKKTRTLESELYDKKGKVTPIRSRTKWINEVKKNTKFFLGLEKRTKIQNTIYELSQVIVSVRF